MFSFIAFAAGFALGVVVSVVAGKSILNELKNIATTIELRLVALETAIKAGKL
jgi:hypothetical protein